MLWMSDMEIQEEAHVGTVPHKETEQVKVVHRENDRQLTTPTAIVTDHAV